MESAFIIFEKNFTLFYFIALFWGISHRIFAAIYVLYVLYVL